MTSVIRAELRRLRTTRSTWVLLGLALILTVTTAALIIADVGLVDVPPRGSAELRNAVLGSVGPAFFVLLVLGVLAITGEFHHHTVTSTFLMTPDRRKVIAAKATATAIVAVAATAALLVLAYGAGLAAGAYGASLDGDLAAVVLKTLAISALWALLGAGVGSVIRNQAIAVVLPLLWFLVVETMFKSYGLSWLQPWLPGGATSALAGAQFPGVLPVWEAFLVLTAYALALLLAGTRAIVRSDVT
jgi:ABC-2 type transport system permease protein